MVEKMPSDESNNSSERLFATDLNLPVFETPQREHWPSGISWEQAMRLFAPFREYMKKFDSPEERLRSKNPARFILP